MNGALIEVVNHNREVQQQALDLNTRLGQQRFPAMTRDELADWIGQRLGDAALCVSDVTDPEVLRLPALDPEAVAQAERDCPDTISVLGHTFDVAYTSGGPAIMIDAREVVGTHGCFPWQNLPDYGVRLPGGGAVLIALSVGRMFDPLPHMADVHALKAAAYGAINREQWTAWMRSMVRPEIPMPDLQKEPIEVPIVEAVYSTCALRANHPLVAYGTFEYDPFGSQPLRATWFDTKEKAEAARRRLLDPTVLPKLQEKGRKAVLEARIQVLRENLRQLAEHHGRALPSDLLRDLQTAAAAYLSFMPIATLEVWVVRAEYLIKEVAEHVREREAEAQAERDSLQAVLSVMGEMNAAREAKALAMTLTRAFKGDTAAAIAYLRELISEDRGARRKLDAVRGKIGNWIGQRDQGYRFFQLSNAREITKWLNGMLAALTGETPSNIPALSSTAQAGGLDLSALRDKFKK